MDIGALFKDLGGGIFKFIYAWVVPSATTAAVFLFLVAPEGLVSKALRQPSAGSTLANGAFLALLTVTVSVGVGLFQLPIYRFLEGYTMPRFLQTRLRRRQARKWMQLSRLHRRSDKLGNRRAAIIAEKLELYPERLEDVMPTRLGNSLKALETFSYNRYQLDSQALWHELLAVSPASVRSDIDEARAPVDFFVSAFTHLVALGVASGSVFALEHSARSLMTALVCILLLPVAYDGAVRNVSAYAATVRALSTLGRRPLADGLGLKMPSHGADERRMWLALSEFTLWQQNGASSLSTLDDYRADQPGDL